MYTLGQEISKSLTSERWRVHARGNISSCLCSFPEHLLLASLRQGPGARQAFRLIQTVALSILPTSSHNLCQRELLSSAYSDSFCLHVRMGAASG